MDTIDLSLFAVAGLQPQLKLVPLKRGGASS